MISLGSPHARPVGRTCGEPKEIELTLLRVKLNGSRCVHARVEGLHDGVHAVVCHEVLDGEAAAVEEHEDDLWRWTSM